MRLRLTLGGPGAGKTERQLRLVEDELAAGTKPHRIAFVSFTKAAVQEAVERACAKFSLTPRDLPYFRTLHSAAYRELGVRRDEVLDRRHLRELGDSLGLELSGRSTMDDEPDAMSEGDRMLFLEGYARSTMKSLEDAWHEAGGDIEWFRLLQFSEALQAYKSNRGLIDFTDMIERYLALGSPLPVEAAFVDEAQDLNPLQWKMVWAALSGAERVYVAGDDDQAIYRWSGADVEQFLSLPADEREVLPVSHRLPRSVFDFAAGIIGRVSRRYEKDWGPRPVEGRVTYHHSLDGVDLSSGSWLLLARNVYMLGPLRRLAEAQGLTYTSRRGHSADAEDVRAILAWEKLRRGEKIKGSEAVAVLAKAKSRRAPKTSPEALYGASDLGLRPDRIWHEALDGIALTRRGYYVSVLRRGGSLTAPPRLRVDTIHGVKGGEADNVLLMTDMTKRTYDGMLEDPDDEARVFYVGATRAREALHVVLPTTSRHYPL